MAINKKDEELWITNVSKERDVMIGDLRISIKRGQSINLLAKDKKGRLKYNVTRKHIDASIESGSISKKSDVIKIRKVAPVYFNTRIDIANTIDKSSNRIFRKATDIEVPDFPDLDGVFEEASEEEMAAEQADMDFIDRKPALSVDPKFDKLVRDDE